MCMADIDLLWSPHQSGTRKHAPPLRVRVKGSVGSTFRRAGAVLVLDVLALGLARVRVRFAVGAADRLEMHWTHARFWFFRRRFFVIVIVIVVAVAVVCDE